MKAIGTRDLIALGLDLHLMDKFRPYCDASTLEPGRIYWNAGVGTGPGEVGFFIRDENLRSEVATILGPAFDRCVVFGNLPPIERRPDDEVIVQANDQERTPIIVYRGGSVVLNFDLAHALTVEYADSKRPIYTYIPFFNVAKIPPVVRRPISEALSSFRNGFETAEQAQTHYSQVPFNRIDLIRILLDRVFAKYMGIQNAIRAWPRGKRAAFVSLHDVDSSGLFGRLEKDPLLKLEENYGIKSTWFCLSTVLARVPRSGVEYLLERGHEIGWHGYNHDHRLPFGKHTLRKIAHLNSSFLVRQKSCPLGMRTPKLLKTKHLFDSVEANCPNLCYDTSFKVGLLPYYLSSTRRILEIPTTVPTDIALRAQLRRMEPTRRARSILQIQIERTEKLISGGAVISIVTHPEWDLSLRPDLLSVYSEYLDYITVRSDIWFTTAGRLYRYWTGTEDLRNGFAQTESEP